MLIQQDTPFPLLCSYTTNKHSSLLQRYPDLRHTDLPSVDKAALKAIATHPQAIRQMVLGFGSLSASIRRFCKKYYPKLGAVAATDLLYLLVESLDPLRPLSNEADGLLGNCGGYASPLGQSIRSANLSTELRRPEIEVYSDASRFVRDVLNPLPSALAATDFETFLLGFEYCYGLGIFYISIPDHYQRPFFQHSPELLMLPGSFPEVLEARAKKGDAQLFAAMHTWLAQQTLLEQDRWQQTSIEPVQARFLALRSPDLMAMSLQRAVAQHFALFPQEQRVALYRQIQASLPQLSDRDQPMLLGSLRHYRERYPEESRQADQKTSSPPPETVSAPLPPPSSSHSTQSAPDFTVDREDALSYLMTLAFVLDLHGVAKDLYVKDLEFASHDAFPAPSGDPGVQKDEALVQAVRQFVKARGRRVSLVALAATTYSDSLFELLQRALTVLLINLKRDQEGGKPDEDPLLLERYYYKLLGLMQTAITFLPDSLFDRWLERWRGEVLALGSFNYGFGPHDPFPRLVRQRFPQKAPFLLLGLQSGKQWPHADEQWQFNLAQVYAQGSDRGRQTVRQHLATVTLEPNPHYRRHDWHPPYLWLISQWWEQGEIELLAIACDRCAIPMYWTGDKAYSPVLKAYQSRPGYAARTFESPDGRIAVAGICQRVGQQYPEFLAGIVQNNLQLSGEERAACTLLTCFARVTADLTPFQQHHTELLDLLESPHSYAIAAGLEIFTHRPELAAELLPDVLLAIDRALASTSTGIAKQAVVCLGQLAIAYPEARAPVSLSLENALYGESKSVLEETLKTWKKLLSKLPEMSFPQTVRQRLQDLSSSDPKRYSKLVQPLLEGQK
uniref:Uncharacterized protein n=1 Tax=Cyanothece sp. (strain PCC 7425 / ATCC 29141) TaxID=395961 RepID=B8HJV9_CYAP4